MSKKIMMMAMVMGLSLACFDDDADVASCNLSKEADNFGLNRRVVFYNGITGEYMLTIEGKLSIRHRHSGGQLEVTVKTGENQFKKHFLGLSDNVTYFCEQLTSTSVSVYHYKVIFKPAVIVPDVKVNL